jgi:hypothetical protein
MKIFMISSHIIFSFLFIISTVALFAHEIENSLQKRVEIGMASESKEPGRLLFSDEEEFPSNTGNVEGENRIAGGRESSYQPWFGQMIVQIDGEYVTRGRGCSFISRKHAVTAAHCISSTSASDM